MQTSVISESVAHNLEKQMPNQDTGMEFDPKSLNLDNLSGVHGSLLGQLMIVNDELCRRYERGGSASGELPTATAEGKLLSHSVAELRNLGTIMRSVRDHMTGPLKRPVCQVQQLRDPGAAFPMVADE